MGWGKAGKQEDRAIPGTYFRQEDLYGQKNGALSDRCFDGDACSCRSFSGVYRDFSYRQRDGAGCENGENILINKLAYKSFTSEKPQVGDVVAFGSDVHGEEGEGSVLVRRVAGGPGDKVEIKDDIFYLNDKPYEKHMVEAVHMEPMGEVTLGKDEIFVLSDDRSSSMDSRNEAIGIIDIGECIGKVCFH